MKKMFYLAAALAASVAGISAPANAKGFLSGIADAIVPGSGEVLDNIHDSMARPLNGVWVGAATAGAEWGLPGSGPIVGGIVSRNNPVGFPGGQGGPVFAQQPMGNFCYTQAGRFGPGPVNPLGSPCTANTPWGVIPGQVGQ